MADADALAPLSADDLAHLQRVLEMLKHPTSSGNYVYAQGQALDHFERLVAQAEREAGLRQAGDYVATQIRQDANAALRADQPARSKRLGELAAYWFQIAHGSRLGQKRQAP